MAISVQISTLEICPLGNYCPDSCVQEVLAVQQRVGLRGWKLEGGVGTSAGEGHSNTAQHMIIRVLLGDS